MAYCRWGLKCDLYMYESIHGGFRFSLIGLDVPADSELRDFTVKTASEALEKLKELKAKGFQIPDYAIENLQLDMKHNSDME